jgi:ATP-dependent Lhr-like helicase
MTTPESLEAMLVSVRVPHRELFSSLRVVVIDEVHAFAGDDRGWHLLALLERLSRLAGRPLQRVGLSATVGNPDTLLSWLQGSNRDRAPGVVVNSTVTSSSAGVAPDLQLDYVGSIDNAATVVAALHRGEKRLVFADSRRTVEALAVRLRRLGVATFVSHSSLARDERHRAEQAFKEARDCVIVSTSTLELGIDVGDLDRVVQIGAPRTVASLLQRLGRTGRRPDRFRNVLLLATTDDELLQAAGLLRLLGEGYVEPVVAPPAPLHLLAQQIVALCLQEGQVGDTTWVEWLEGSWTGTGEQRGALLRWLCESGHLDSESGMLFVGPAAERRFGRRNFLELLSVFTADPQFTVLHGRAEVGTVDPMMFTRRVEGPRILALAGRSWLVTHVEWRRQRAFVEPTDLQGSSRWFGLPQPLSFALTDSVRRVVVDGTLQGATLSRRASSRLGLVRAKFASCVDPESSILAAGDGEGCRWWTWAGARANAVLLAGLGEVAPDMVEHAERLDNRFLRLASSISVRQLGTALRTMLQRYGDDLSSVVAEISDEAVRQLKFSELLPPDVAAATLSARGADWAGAAAVARRTIRASGRVRAP